METAEIGGEKSSNSAHRTSKKCISASMCNMFVVKLGQNIQREMIIILKNDFTFKKAKKKKRIKRKVRAGSAHPAADNLHTILSDFQNVNNFPASRSNGCKNSLHKRAREECV